MKTSDSKAMGYTFVIGLAAAYAFAIASVRFGPFPGVAHKAAPIGK